MTYTHPPGQQLQSEFRMVGGGFTRMVVPFVFVLLLGGVLFYVFVTRLGTVRTQVANPKKVGGDLQVSVGAMKTLGLIGWGERITPKRIPGWMRDQLSRVPTNPADGRPEVAIPLGGGQQPAPPQRFGYPQQGSPYR